MLGSGKWMCKDGYTSKQVPNIPDPELNTWYAIKIDWCRDGTAWEGLANKKWQVTVNDVCSGQLTYNNNNNNDPNYFRMFTSEVNTNEYAIYYDALSFSWDEGYDEDMCLICVPHSYEYLQQGDCPGTYSFKGTFDFKNSISNITSIQISTHGTDANYRVYLDALGSTADWGYQEGTNLIDQCVNIENEYYLDIPGTGVVYDGDLALKIESLGEVQGNGMLNAVLYKQASNNTLSDCLLLNSTAYFSSGTSVSLTETIDLTDKLEDIKSFQGTYLLRTVIKSTMLEDLFNVTQFSIITDTYITPDFLTNYGYQTDPASNDTDGDGWLDYKEIYEEGTSPLSVDMDVDDAWDPQDRDPIRDYMLEINPEFVYYPSEASEGRLVQSVVTFDIGGEEHCIITPIAQINHNKMTYFDKHYYVNVDDSTVRQGSTLTIHIQLWWIRQPICADELVVEDYVVYTLGEVGDLYTCLYASDTDECQVRVRPVGMEKANTIAIYGANSSFTGHYASNQRYSLIQLDVLGSGYYEGTHNFAREELNATGEDISVVDDLISGDAHNIALDPEVDGHLKVLEVTSSSSTAVEFDHDLGSHADNLITIEFWWRTTDKTKEF